MDAIQSIQKVTLGRGEQSLSALYAPASTNNSKALIIALHGGTYSSSYFHLEDQPDLSLLKLGSEIGYSVLSIDRPGYGIAEELNSSFDYQIPIIRNAINQAISEYELSSDKVFLVGHSIGAMIAMLLAKDSINGTLLGLDLSGAGFEFYEESKTALSHLIEAGPLLMDKQSKDEIFYGPSWTRSEEVLNEDVATFLTSAKEVEIKDAIDWENRIYLEGPQIKVPIQFTLGEYDNLWKNSSEIMEKTQEIFSVAPFVQTHVQRFAGHCNHLHHVGRAYNLRTLAFVDECISYQSTLRV